MGKNLPAKKYKVGNRTERFLHYELDAASGTDSHYIDLAAGLSAVNKRFYRQGLYYYIKSISIVETTIPTKVQFGTAPDVWQIPQAWKLGFRNWSKMNSEAARTIPGGDLKVAGKYHDFKIYLKDAHLNDGDVTVPTNGPAAMDGTPHYNPDAWDYSRIHSLHPDSDTANNAGRDAFNLHLLGTHIENATDDYTSVSLCESYRIQRNLLATAGVPTQTDNIGDDPLLQMFDVANQYDDIIDDLQDFNDLPPYDDNGQYLDTIMRAQCQINPQQGNAMLPGFCVPFGLLEVLTTCNDGSNTVKVLIELAPGPYHGVYAERVV